MSFLSNTANNYSSGTVSITDSAGVAKIYLFSSDCGTTGLENSDKVMVYLGNVTSSASADYANEFLSAFHGATGNRVYSRQSGSTVFLTQRRTGSAGYKTIA